MIQRRFRPAGNGLLIDNPLNYEGLRLDSRMENGYEEGYTRGGARSVGTREDSLRSSSSAPSREKM